MQHMWFGPAIKELFQWKLDIIKGFFNWLLQMDHRSTMRFNLNFLLQAVDSDSKDPMPSLHSNIWTPQSVGEYDTSVTYGSMSNSFVYAIVGARSELYSWIGQERKLQLYRHLKRSMSSCNCWCDYGRKRPGHRRQILFGGIYHCISGSTESRHTSICQ